LPFQAGSVQARCVLDRMPAAVLDHQKSPRAGEEGARNDIAEKMKVGAGQSEGNLRFPVAYSKFVTALPALMG
jgi:hypothetical protein